MSPMREFSNIIDIAAGFKHIMVLDKYGDVAFSGEECEGTLWHGAECIAACEAHSAIIRNDGSVYEAAIGNAWEIKDYSKAVREWQNIRQIALTFECAFGLTDDGKLSATSWDGEGSELLFDTDKRIVQIDAFGAYYCNHFCAALFEDGTVNVKEIVCSGFRNCRDDVQRWINSLTDIKKVCCGFYPAVTALTNGGTLLFPDYETYVDMNGKQVRQLENIVDMDANFEHVVAVDNIGSIIYLHLVR
ncbi:hypothetical protein IJT93_03990 [bacterium]|nr:hypothetical protein [bacterium]